MVEGLRKIVKSCPFLVTLSQMTANKFHVPAHAVQLGQNLSVRKNVFVLSEGENEIQFGKTAIVRNNRFYIKGKKNRIRFGDKVQIYGMEGKASIHIDGNRNTILVDDEAVLRFVHFFIWGNDNLIHIGRDASITFTEVHIEQDHNKCILAERNTTHGRESKWVQFELDEGTAIEIGADCMISNDVVFRTSDSHSMLDEKKQRINPGKDITVGEHCWFGMRSLILKGSVIPNHTVIGAASVCTRPFAQSNTAIAGNPAAVVKCHIDWDRKFIVSGENHDEATQQYQ
ncbi:acyltransferase [Flavonifractor hominis]|uniref:Acyltransferase n=1 Tax=Flavonifractor hominis TaxID=3133178 RepID=A0ABV1ENX7_9FIRM